MLENGHNWKSGSINWRWKNWKEINGLRRRNPMYEKKKKKRERLETRTHGSLRNPKHMKRF